MYKKQMLNHQRWRVSCVNEWPTKTIFCNQDIKTSCLLLAGTRSHLLGYFSMRHWKNRRK